MSLFDGRRSPWTQRYRPAPGAPISLVCLPHAGGSAPFFKGVAEALNPDTNVLAVQYPGRLERRNEPLITSLTELAERVVDELLPWTDRPLALFGHSLGSVLGFEVARRLTDKGRPPIALFASGRRAPWIQRPDFSHQLDGQGLLRAVAELGGTDPHFLDDEDLIRLALPAIRADYRAVETYRYEPGPPLGCPVTVLTGRDDPKVSADDADAWRVHTAAAFDVITLPGGHFYLVDQHTAVTGVLADRLADVAGPLRRSSAAAE
ncbi:thioesterase II family protein [Streptomyces sp. NPDC059218]|uniref:thioesterase II family protein n=1 Tax=unclassified Streptomyces TaxID=2593676 RepID=UPI00369F8EAE